MESAEASGKTVEDALNRALEQLGASREEVEFVVLDEGRRGGLFGRGARDWTIRVDRLAPGASPAAEVQAPDARPGRSQSGAAPRPANRERSERPPRGSDRGPRSGTSSRGRDGLDQPMPKLTMDDFLKPGGAGGAGAANDAQAAPAPAPRPARSTGPRPSSGSPRAPRPDAGPPPERRRRDEEKNVAPDIDAEDVDFAAHIIDDLLRIMEIDAELTIREPLTPGDGVGGVKAVIDIRGEGLGLLIGRRGDTLTAFQYLVNLIVGRRYPGDGGVTIDVEHYRHRREEQIVSLAQRMAARVRETGSPITLEPMSPAERRLVHVALGDDPDLETNSIGEGENRKVVISSRT